MDKMAFYFAYANPATALELYEKCFGDVQKSADMTKTAGIREFAGSIWHNPQYMGALAGAGVGAVGGGLIGAGVSGRRNRRRNALKGALIGAGVGGVGGYLAGPTIRSAFPDTMPYTGSTGVSPRSPGMTPEALSALARSKQGPMTMPNTQPSVVPSTAMSQVQAPLALEGQGSAPQWSPAVLEQRRLLMEARQLAVEQARQASAATARRIQMQQMRHLDTSLPQDVNMWGAVGNPAFRQP